LGGLVVPVVRTAPMLMVSMVVGLDRLVRVTGIVNMCNLIARHRRFAVAAHRSAKHGRRQGTPNG